MGSNPIPTASRSSNADPADAWCSYLLRQVEIDRVSQTLTDGDEGKTVVDRDGNEVGTIDRVEHGTAYIDADEGLIDGIKSMLGDDGDGTYTLVGTDVERVTDDEVRLREH